MAVISLSCNSIYFICNSARIWYTEVLVDLRDIFIIKLVEHKLRSFTLVTLRFQLAAKRLAATTA